jgi:chromosome segregation ATPase
LLGAGEIKTLADLENLLGGKTLKELKESHAQELETKISNRNFEISKLAEQLDHTKERLSFYTDNLKTKESLIFEYQQELKDKDQNLTNLQKKNEKLAQKKVQRESELQNNLALLEQKITDQDQALINLAKQKLTNQKQAKALVQQIEAQ